MNISYKNKTNKKKILKIIFIYIISIIISFLIGFFTCSETNKYNGEFVSIFTYSNVEDINYLKIQDKDYLLTIKENHSNKGLDNININKMLENNDFTISEIDTNTYKITTKTKYYNTSFISSSKTVISRAKTFINYAVKDYNQNSSITFVDGNNVGTIKNTFSPWYSSLISMGLGTLIFGTILAFFPKDKIKVSYIEDNKTIFHTPFHKEYWKFSLSTLKDVRSIVTLGMLFGFVLISKLIKLPSGFGDLGLSIAFIFLATIGWIYGPIVGLMIGFLSDVIGFFIAGTAIGDFNLGYTLQAMLAVFTYGIMFYRTKMTFSKILLTRIIINFFINTIMGSFLYILVYTQYPVFSNDFMLAMNSYLLLLELPKNIVYLLPQSIVLFMIFKSIGKYLGKMNYIPKEVGDNITIF